MDPPPPVEIELDLSVVIRTLNLLELVPRNGLEALRFRRTLQLPESTLAVKMPACCHSARVSEAFAVHYEETFLRDSAPEVHLRADMIPRLVSLLKPGDLCMLTATDCTFDMRPSRTRIMWQQLQGHARPLFIDGTPLQQGESGRVLRIPPQEVHTAASNDHDAVLF